MATPSVFPVTGVPATLPSQNSAAVPSLLDQPCSRPTAGFSLIVELFSEPTFPPLCSKEHRSSLEVCPSSLAPASPHLHLPGTRCPLLAPLAPDPSAAPDSTHLSLLLPHLPCWLSQHSGFPPTSLAALSLLSPPPHLHLSGLEAPGSVPGPSDYLPPWLTLKMVSMQVTPRYCQPGHLPWVPKPHIHLPPPQLLLATPVYLGQTDLLICAP